MHGMKGAHVQAAKDRGFLRDESSTAHCDDALRHAQDPLRLRDAVGRPPLAATTTLDAAMDDAMDAGGKTSSHAAAEAVSSKSKRAEMNRKGRAGKPTVCDDTVGVVHRTCTRARAHAHACAHACAARASPRARHPHAAPCSASVVRPASASLVSITRCVLCCPPAGEGGLGDVGSVSHGHVHPHHCQCAAQVEGPGHGRAVRSEHAGTRVGRGGDALRARRRQQAARPHQ